MILLLPIRCEVVKTRRSRDEVVAIACKHAMLLGLKWCQRARCSAYVGEPHRSYTRASLGEDVVITGPARGQMSELPVVTTQLLALFCRFTACITEAAASKAVFA